MDKVYYAIYGSDSKQEWLASTEFGDPMIFGSQPMANHWFGILRSKYPELKYTIKKVKIFGTKEV